MLIALAGVSGVGKSYYKNKIVEKLNFEKIKIITTRPMRIGEKADDEKIFVTDEQLDNMIKDEKIAYEFEYDLVKNRYAYTKQELFSNKNMVFELHYKTIYDMKRICHNMKAIYLLPQDIEIAKQKVRERMIEPSAEEKRIREVQMHYQKIMEDEELRNMFDYTLYNNYDKASEDKVIELVNKLILEEK